MITKDRLRRNVDKTKDETKSALQLLYDNLNKGQQKKIARLPEVKALLERYGVVI